MKAIDDIGHKVVQTLSIDPPDEVFRPALEKAMYKAMLTTLVAPLIEIQADWLAMVVCENIQMDLLSIQQYKEMEGKISGTISR